MKKNRLIILSILVLCMLVFTAPLVNAARLNLHGVAKNSILGVNTFRMNDPELISYSKVAASRYAEEVDSAFNGAAPTPYHLFRVWNKDAYISAIYENVGWFNDGTGEKPVNAVMTLSNFNSAAGDVTSSGWKLGFNHYGLTWILLLDGGSVNGLNADVEIFFYYANDDTRQPIDMKSAFIGVGGYNSEKRVWNTGTPHDQAPGIAGRQWEWISFDSQTTQAIDVYYLDKESLVQGYTNRRFISYVPAGESFESWDADGATMDYGWGVGEVYSYGREWMRNPTGLNVLSNAGMRWGSDVYPDIHGMYSNFDKYTNEYQDKTMYMAAMGRITNYSTQLNGIVSTRGRADGQPFSLFKFQSGKDIGSVELGLAPVALATEVTPPSKAVDKVTTRETENLKYTITQYIGNMRDNSKRINQRDVYTSLVITDPLPAEVEFVSAYAKNENGTVIARYENGTPGDTSACAINYNPTTHTVTYTFNENYLRYSMRYVGEAYTFEINTKVKDLSNTATNDYIVTDKASTTFNNQYTAETNEVKTQVLYDILTKGEHTTISEMITEIKGGEDGKKVVFTPELGYYIDSVEWQTQPERYAPSTSQLPNVTEIPPNNKVKIPEIKDGSENTYKHEVTMTEVVPEDERDTLNYDPFGETTFTYNDVDNNHYIKVVSKPMKMVIRISKEDAVTGKQTQGDATFEGAVYTIYRDQALTDVVETVTLDKAGNGSSTQLPLGTYYVKETIAPEGYLLDENVYMRSQTAEQQTAQRLKVSYHDITSKEEVKKGRIEVIKYDDVIGSTEKDPSVGAILRLTLDSNPSVYYELTINENGYGEFINETLKAYYPYTIPYGYYTITEVKESDAGENTAFFIQPEKVSVTREHQHNYYTMFEDPIPEAYINVQKTDAVKGHVVEIAGAKFKIWNCQTNDWISHKLYPSGEYTTVFETNETGEFITPQKVQAGEYIIYEVEAPKGYMLNPDWAIPENVNDIGNKEKGGKYIKIDKVALGIDRDTPANDVEYFYCVEMPNEPLKGKLEITKKAEVLSNVTTSRTDGFGDKHTPVYTIAGLPGVTYDIIAAENIKSPDGNAIYVAAGTKVATITTGENGIATTPDLFLGEYRIVETSVPEGYVINSNIENVTIENNTINEAVVTTKQELVNKRQKLKLTLKKEFEDIDFIFEEEIKAIFGVYADQDIKNNAGQIIIPKDSLVDVIEYVKSDEDDVTSSIDLPQGKYYVKELQVSFPYTISDETIKVELLHSGTVNEYVTYSTDKVLNTYNGTTISLIKLPTTIVEDVVVDSEGVVDTDFDEVTSQIIEQIKGRTKEEIRELFDEMGWEGLAGAEYQVYLDKECKNPLLMKDATGEYNPVTLISDEFGMMVLENVPVGIYYLKETKAPPKYQITKDVIMIETTLQDTDTVAYRVLKEESVIGGVIQKVDIFTGEVVPNCIFEIYDKDGNTLMRSVTDEEGVGQIAVSLFKDGETYFFKEIYAPDQYYINTEVQEFVAEFDENGEWIPKKIEIDNTRKNIDELIMRKVDDKTGEPLEGCKFSIIALDENGKPVLIEDGEYVYLVKDAVTGENGEYIVEKPYFGNYKFIEIEAPEGYELTINKEEMTFVIDGNSPDTVIYEVTNVLRQEPPATGDIAVVALAGVAILSVAGIVFVIIRNRKKASKR